MLTVKEHYESHLAPIYAWAVGGIDAALARGGIEVDALWPDGGHGKTAVDLGAGFGMHAVPLARRGWSVVALDTSATLLAELRRLSDSLPIRVLEDDLLAFARHAATPDLILIMGDTLTHLPDLAALDALIAAAALKLAPRGQFVATFRDYSVTLQGADRFITARRDADRILTCFLEYDGDYVTVHDVISERTGGAWDVRANSYRKIRLAPCALVERLQQAGFSVRTEPGMSGMTRIVATRL